MARWIKKCEEPFPAGGVCLLAARPVAGQIVYIPQRLP